MKAKEMMKKAMMIAALAGATALPAMAETLCSGESAEVKLDLATGTMRTAAATETLTYSTEWDGGSAVTLAVNGTTLASGLAGSGTYDWTPSGSGLFTLTHTTTTSSGDVVLTAAFVIPPNYVAPVYVDDDAANGIDHWVTNTVPSGYTVVESAASRVTWGTAGKTSWYVVIDDDIQIDGGVQCKGNVHLVLCDGAKLTVTNVADSCAGIATDASGSFTIYGTPEGAGELSATAGRWYGAGIGGGDMEDGSHITINGGTVTATGGSCGAGIGGGEFASGTDIVINGGIVYAKCIRVDGGAGIGGGYWGAGKDIVINGGVVYAEGGFGNAAIGGGSEEKGSDIAINGGKVSVFTVISMNYVGTEKEKAEVGDFIGSGNLADAAENVSIADSASVCFNLSGVYRGSPPPYKWIEEPAPSPKDFEGFVIMTPSTQRVDCVLVGGVQNWTAAKTFALTNAVTGATGEIVVNGEGVAFANKLLSLPHTDNKLMLTAERYSMINPPTEVAHTTAKVYTNAVEDATLVETPIVVRKDAAAYVVYTAADGYVFADGTTAKTNAIDTSVNPATAEAPDAPTKQLRYVAPVYVDNIASNGIAYWTTNAVPSGYTVVTSSEDVWLEGWYVVDGDVQIDGGVECVGNVNLVLCDGAKLTVTNCAENHAGIQTDASGSFTIYGTPDGAGELSATAGEQGAGIGGGKNGAGSHITINGGVVNAVGGIFASSIGGGAKGTGSDITINGGVVTAIGVVLKEETSAAAGIGGGNYGDGSHITINGGTVTAVGRNLSAGIGGGSDGNGSNITINGGVVKATGGAGGAGIGGGSEGAGSDIAINGGTISAIGCMGGAAIGGGQMGSGSNVRIADAAVSVQATATYYEGDYYVAEFIGNGMMSGAEAADIEIDASANVLFNLTGLMSGEGGYIEEPASMPEAFEGFIIMTPETQTLDRVLVGGVANWTAATAFALTNAVTGATGEITVNGEDVIFANKLLSLPHEDSKLTLTASPIPPVAQIVTGTTTNKYETIAAAFEAAQNGDTITMIDDVALTDMASSAYVTVPGDKTLTFDLNGKTIYFEHNKAEGSKVFEVYGELTVQDTSDEANGTVVYKPLQPCMGWAYGNYLFEVGGAGKMTMASGTIENKGEGGICFAVEMGSGAEVVVNGGNVLARASAIRAYSYLLNYPAKITVNDGYIAGSCALYCQSSGAADITVNGGTLVGTSYAVYLYGAKENINLNINGGTMRATSNSGVAIASYLYEAPSTIGEPVLIYITGGDLFASWCLYSWEYTGNQQVYISGGKFSGWYITAKTTKTNTTLVDITGGVYDYYWMPSNYLHEGYAVGSNDDPATKDAYPYEVKPAVASIDTGAVTNYYGWLDEAFYYVSTNQIIEVLQDNTEDIYVDKDFTFTVDSNGHKLTGKVEVRDGYEFVDNGDGTCTYRIKTIDEVPCAKDDETVVAEGEKPEETKEEVWEKATNIVATVTTADAPVIVADSELTNTVEQAKQEFEVGNTNVTKVLAFVDVVVTPTGAEADADDKVRTVTMDVTPYLTTWAEVTDGETFETNKVAETTSEFEYSGKSMSISFDVSNLAAEPMLVIHRHGTEELRYTRGTAATDSTFAYDAENAEITLLMSNFSEIEIHSDIQVGDNAWATVGKDGACTITGTGAMWNSNEWPESKNPLIGYKKLIRSVAVADGVTSVGSKAFHKFYALTNVTCAASVANVGTLAFYNCLSLEKLAFAGTKPTLGDETLFFHSAIYMKDGVPTVEMIPEIEIGGYTKVLKGSNDLKLWEIVTEETKGNYHFFKFVMEPVPNGE